jgi:hypothetical protein
MNHRFVVLKNSVIQIDCPCRKCEGSKKIAVRKGSILTITPEKKFIDQIGWHFLFEINNDYKVYISIYDFLDKYNEEMFCSFLDFDLKYNYLEFKVNKALDEKNAFAFAQFATELNEMKELKGIILDELSVH